MQKSKTHKKFLLLGLMSAGVLGSGFGWHNARVCADGTCGDRWGGSPSDSPSVSWKCVGKEHVYEIDPVNYKQTIQNPCEGTTAQERDCELTYEFKEVRPNNNNTPNDPDDDYDDYIFSKTDSCYPTVSSSEPKNPPLECCIQ